MRDIAIVSFAQADRVQPEGQPDVLAVLPVVTEALSSARLTRKDIDFVCSGSADYLGGGVFSFVQTLEAAGAWPPISESHVEMDGAWALYEAWVRLQHGDFDTALVYSTGRPNAIQLDEVLNLQTDPYYLSPLAPSRASLAALQAQAVLACQGCSEKDLAAIAARSLRDAKGNPYADVSGDFEVSDLLAAPYVAEPLRAHDCPPKSAGAAAVVLVAGERARELCERPAWITGIDHRIDAQYPGLRDLALSPSAQLAGEKAGAGRGPIEVAELCAAYSHEELILREALRLGPHVAISPSGGALASHPLMVAGLIRIGEAFRQIHAFGKNRTLGHATAGPCLQQNLICVLEAK